MNFIIVKILCLTFSCLFHYPTLNEKNSILEDLYIWDRNSRRYCEGNDIKNRDKLNQQILTQYIDKYGFPKCEDSLSDAAYHGAFYTIQHSNFEMMQIYLEDIKNLVNCKKLEIKKYAMMVDRISEQKTGFQIYGTQFYRDTSDNYLKLCPFRNKDSVQYYRNLIGLDSIDVNMKIQLHERK